ILTFNSNIMRDNMIINIAGKPGHGMGIDMKIEHIIDALKFLLASKGVYSDWKKYRDYTAAIKSLEALKRTVLTSMKTTYQKAGHSAPDTSRLVWQVASAAESWRLLDNFPDREENQGAVAFPDLIAIGHKKFESSVLKNFNRKIVEWRDG
ncbi:hypothetical protein K435DRAFT_582693, partial [Dendrothele bispora CBS 962.96]